MIDLLASVSLSLCALMTELFDVMRRGIGSYICDSILSHSGKINPRL